MVGEGGAVKKETGVGRPAGDGFGEGDGLRAEDSRESLGDEVDEAASSLGLREGERCGDAASIGLTID